MTAAWLSAALGVAAVACVSPVDYGEPSAVAGIEPEVDAPPPCIAYGDNEDDDCVGDKPDLCPTVAEPMQLDTDEDGVGDACDRQPDDVDNDIAFFAGFGPNDKPRSWGGSSWYIRDGSLTLSVIDATGSAYPTGPEDELRSPLLVVADLRVTALEAAEVSLFIEYAAELRDGSECYVQSSLDGRTAVLGWSEVHDGIRDAEQSTAVLPPFSEEGQRFELIVEHVVNGAVTEARCTYAATSGYTATLSRPTGHDGRGRLRVAAANAHAHVDSLIAYSLVYP